MSDKKLGGAGLRGQVAGETALCTVGKTGTGLTYRGLDISLLAEKAKFEEIAYLLLKGDLPTQTDLDRYINKLKRLQRHQYSNQYNITMSDKYCTMFEIINIKCNQLQ